MALRLALASRNAAVDAVIDRLDLGTGAATIQIRSGAQPATPETAASGTLLATVTLLDPATPAATASGTGTIANPVAVTGAADGTAGWARFLDSSGAVVMDCNITATGGGGDITLSTTTISTGVSVDLDAITFTVPM